MSVPVKHWGSGVLEFSFRPLRLSPHSALVSLYSSCPSQKDSETRGGALQASSSSTLPSEAESCWGQSPGPCPARVSASEQPRLVQTWVVGHEILRMSEESQEAPSVDRGESQAGAPFALGHWESGLPWGPEDTLFSARPERQSGPKITQYPLSVRLGALP